MYRVRHDQSPLYILNDRTVTTCSPHTQLSTHPPIHLSVITHPFCHPWITPFNQSSYCLPPSLPTPISLPPCSRIYEILPQRIQQWQQSPCIAEEHGKKLLERIRREQQSARTRLQEMERRFHELEAIILRAKQQAVREDEEVS